MMPSLIWGRNMYKNLGCWWKATSTPSFFCRNVRMGFSRLKCVLADAACNVDPQTDLLEMTMCPIRLFHETISQRYNSFRILSSRLPSMKSLLTTISLSLFTRKNVGNVWTPYTLVVLPSVSCTHTHGSLSHEYFQKCMSSSNDIW